MELKIDDIAACIMDMDGVVTDTASLHAAAWKRMFDEFLQKRPPADNEELHPFDIQEDYLGYVDGKPRYDGAASFLASRNISLSRGSPDDSPDVNTVCGLGNRKNMYFEDILREKGATAYDSTRGFIRRGQDAGLRFGLISASRNARMVLEATGLTNLFEVIVDGADAADLGLAGKPEPDIFLEAAGRLGVDPRHAMVIEDARAGVQAGKKGGFAMVVGVDRSDQADDLKRSGAHLVVQDLGSLVLVRTAGEAGRPPLVSALDRIGHICNQLHQGISAIFLDYDGTLTPIVDDPADARMDDRTRKILERVAEHYFVAVISGRALDDIRKLVGITGLVYAGSHGFEVSNGSGYFDDRHHQENCLRVLDTAEKMLVSLTGDERSAGVRIERKPYAIAVHYRGVAEDAVALLERKVEKVVERCNGLRKTGGKMIFELRPAVDWDKGKALWAILERFHVDCSRVTPLYIGDDTTDEDAFRSIAENGVPILVSESPGRTAAGYVLRNTWEVSVLLEKLAEVAGREMARGSWALTYDGFEPEKEKLRESLCTLGNGYFASRGAFPEASAGRIHYPGTYIGGCYNRLQSVVNGKRIENESMVNVPNWLSLAFRLGDDSWIEMEKTALLDYRQELDMAAGILRRKGVFMDGKGRQVDFSEQRFVSMHAPHIAGLEMNITVRNWSGSICIRSALDGRVSNTLVSRYQQLNNDHLEVEGQGMSEDGGIIWLQVRTRQSGVRISEAGRTRFFIDEKSVESVNDVVDEPGYIGTESVIPLNAGETLRIEKIIALYSSRDHAISESGEAARQEVFYANDFSDLLVNHRRAWRHLWERCGIDIRVEGSRIPQILNLHIFHLLQTVSVHSIDLDVGVPPRGLHGEAYRGLIMWDELFVFPFFNLRIPDLSRALLQYRYRRLPEAKRAARNAGYKGAMFPWQSGSNGREETQTLHLNPHSGRWITDDSGLQRHINIAVAYNVWLYYQVSGDLDFLCFYGAEMIVEIARFWASMVSYNRSLGRYEIQGVMGPDEFHTGYPDTSSPGLNNNAYTNVMVVWLLCRALDVLELLPNKRRQALWENLSLADSELELWDDISRKIRLVFHDNGIISQFEGYEDLEEFDWQKYRKKYGNIHRLDRILEAEGNNPNRYRISKQADVLMLFYLLSADELRQLFQRLGYPFPYETIPRNIEYYLKRTCNGSTLSRVVHAWVLARSRRVQSWNLFCESLKSDVCDIQEGTTHEGIHLGAMAGTVDLIQRAYSGLETRENILWFNPALPEEVGEMSFTILYRRHWLRVIIEQKIITLVSQDECGTPIQVGLGDSVVQLAPGATITRELPC